MFGPLADSHNIFKNVLANWKTVNIVQFSLLSNLSKLMKEAFKLRLSFQKLLSTTIHCSWDRILIYCIHIITWKFHIFDTSVIFCSLRKWRMFHMTRLEPRKEKFTWKDRTTLNFRPGRWKDLRENRTYLKHRKQKIKWRKRTR